MANQDSGKQNGPRRGRAGGAPARRAQAAHRQSRELRRTGARMEQSRRRSEVRRTEESVPANHMNRAHRRSSSRRPAQRHLPAQSGQGNTSAHSAGSQARVHVRTKQRPDYLLTAPVMIPAAVKWLLFAVLIFSVIRQTAVSTVSSTPFDTMAAAVTASADLTNTAEADNQMIRRLYGIVPADYDGALLYCPKTNMGAEELFLLRLKSPSQETEALSLVEARIEKQKKSFEGYGVDQTEMLENSILLSEGSYILFYSGNDPSSVKSAFLHIL